MVCKEDVVSWFNELESYKRIEAMCTLLNMCLPFELRFLGTCIEDLGRRDFQLLRGVAHSVNNSGELSAIYDSCLSGGPSDQRIRRKLALYVALLRTGSTLCVNDLYRVLSGWDYNDLLTVPPGVPLEEILLLYTLAHWHPVFSFDQRQHCGNIVKKLMDERILAQSSQSSTPMGLHGLSKPMSQVSPTSLQIDISTPTMHNLSPNQSISSTTHSLVSIQQQQPLLNTAIISDQHQQNLSATNLSNVCQTPPLTIVTSHHHSHSPNLANQFVLPNIVSEQSSTGHTNISIGGNVSSVMSSEVMIAGAHIIPPVLTMGDFTVPPGPWSRATVMNQGPVPITINPIEILPYTTSPSPLLSQPTSPTQSRAPSPTLNQNQNQQQKHHQPLHISQQHSRSPSVRSTTLQSTTGNSRTTSTIQSRKPQSESTPPLTTSPPVISTMQQHHLHQQQQQHVPVMMTSSSTTTSSTSSGSYCKDVNVTSSLPSLHKSSQKQLGNYTLHEVIHMDEENLLKFGMPAGAMNQLRNIVNCNGYCLQTLQQQQLHNPNIQQNTIINQSQIPTIQQNINCQISMNRVKHSHQPTIYCANQLQALRLDAESSRHLSSEGESGSSGSAGHSPPDTPAPSYTNTRTKESRCRINGRPQVQEKIFTSTDSLSSIASGSGTLPTATTQYAYLPHSHFTSPRSTVFTHFPPNYRPPPQIYQPNGDIVYPFPPPPPFIAATTMPVYQQSNSSGQKLSCWNCGGNGHTGMECKEPTMEDITRPGSYQLDYSTNNQDLDK